MRTNYALCALCTVLLLLSMPLRCQKIVDRELGVSIQFDGKPNLAETNEGCKKYTAWKGRVEEYLQVCIFKTPGTQSDEQIQSQFTDGVKRKFDIVVEHTSVAGVPGIKFRGNRILSNNNVHHQSQDWDDIEDDYESPGLGSWLWGEVTDVRYGAELRVYWAAVSQEIEMRRDTQFKKMDSMAEHFLNSLQILDQPQAPQSAIPSTTTSTAAPPAENATTPPATAIAGELAALNPPATEQEIDLYNKLKVEKPDAVSAFIHTRKWFRQVYAMYPNPRAAGVDINKFPPLPDDFQMDYALNADEQFIAMEVIM